MEGLRHVPSGTMWVSFGGAARRSHEELLRVHESIHQTAGRTHWSRNSGTGIVQFVERGGRCRMMTNQGNPLDEGLLLSLSMRLRYAGSCARDPGVNQELRVAHLGALLLLHLLLHLGALEDDARPPRSSTCRPRAASHAPKSASVCGISVTRRMVCGTALTCCSRCTAGPRGCPRPRTWSRWRRPRRRWAPHRG